MFALLELAIGLALFYLLVAVLSSYLVEMIASYTNLRASGLERFIAYSFGEGGTTANTSWTRAFYSHPVIQALYSPAAGLKGTPTQPSYIPTQSFSATLIDLIRSKGCQQSPGSPLQITDIQKLLQTQNLPPGLAAVIGTSLSNGQATITSLRSDIEYWFNANMERASGWYKRHTQLWLFVSALLIAGIFNLDSYYVANMLLRQPELASRAADLATRLNPGDGSTTLANLTSDMKYLIGYGYRQPDADQLLDAKSEKDAKSAALALIQANHLNLVDGIEARTLFTTLVDNPEKSAGERFKKLLTNRTMPACPAPQPSEGKEMEASPPDIGFRILTLHCRILDPAPTPPLELDKEAEAIFDAVAASPQRTIDPALGSLLKTYLLADEKISAGALEKTRNYLDARKKSAEALKGDLGDVLSRLPKVGLLCDVAGNWSASEWVSAILGWLTTALLASLGAPFWFELLGRLVNLRGVGGKPESNLPHPTVKPTTGA